MSFIQMSVGWDGVRERCLSFSIHRPRLMLFFQRQCYPQDKQTRQVHVYARVRNIVILEEDDLFPSQPKLINKYVCRQNQFQQWHEVDWMLAHRDWLWNSSLCLIVGNPVGLCVGIQSAGDHSRAHGADAFITKEARPCSGGSLGTTLGI